MNKEKATVTDLSIIRKLEENKPYLDFAESIIRQIKDGKSKDEVLHMILAAKGGLVADQREMKFFTDMVDIVFRWYYKNKGNESQVALVELVEEMDKNQKYLYKGKDGKDYATRAELEAANEEYKNKSTKNM